MLIVAAEVYDVEAGNLSGWGDEEPMVFSDPAAVESVTWLAPRAFSSIEIHDDDSSDVFTG